MQAPRPPSEAARLDALDASGALVHEPNGSFHQLVELAAAACGGDRAAVSFVDESVEVIVASLELERATVPRGTGPASVAVEEDRVITGEAWSLAPAVGTTGWVAAAPVHWTDGNPIGAISVFFPSEDAIHPGGLRLLGVIAELTTAVLEKQEASHAAAAADRRIGRLSSLLAQLLQVQEAERERIAYEIHEDAVQVLATAGMGLDLFCRRVALPEELRALENLRELVKDSIDKMRRLSSDLRPPTLEYGRLGSTIQGEVAKRAVEADFRADVTDHLKTEPRDPVRIMTFRLVQDTIALVVSASRVDFVDVVLDDDADWVTISIEVESTGLRVQDVEESAGWHSLLERTVSFGGDGRLPGARSGVLLFEYRLPLN